MKINYLLIMVFAISNCNAQSFVWGKRGGSITTLPNSLTSFPELVYSIATDSNKNIYMLSPVGGGFLNIDGNDETTYGGAGTADIALVSFACDGTFRWSKIIGGNNFEEFPKVVVDANDNIYIGGSFGGIPQNPFLQHIDDDVVFPVTTTENKRLILIKFNSDGALQWYRRPQADNLSQTDANSVLSKGFEIGDDGTLYWLVYIKPGIYADGSYTTSDAARQWHVLKYNGDGNFVGGVQLDLQSIGSQNSQKFSRNPYNGNFYFSARTGNNPNNNVWAIVGNENVSHSTFISYFDPAGNALWKREDTSNTVEALTFYDPAFDSDNNIYVAGRLIGSGSDSFMGFIETQPLNPAFIMKLDSTGTNVLWVTSHNKYATLKGAIVLNGDELGFTNNCLGADFTWGNQTLAATSSQGYRVLFARFNRDTGECLSLNKVNSSEGSYDIGTALAVDASGDYILGGQFSSSLTFDNGSTVTSVGGQSDFFISKFATQACQPLAVKENKYAPKAVLYPNPAQEYINVDVEERTEFKIYNPQGMLLRSGNIEKSSSNIDVANLPSGVYFVKLGNAETVKFVKK